MARPATAQISRTKWAILFSEQGGCCAGCFKPLGDDVHVDHVMPLARGGDDAFENLQLLHASCNQVKGDMRPEAWFRRSWLRLLAERRERPDRQQVTVTLDPHVAERLRFAAELARKTVAAMIEESLAATLAAAGMRPERAAPRRLLRFGEAEMPAFQPTWSDVTGAENADLFEGRE